MLLITSEPWYGQLEVPILNSKQDTFYFTPVDSASYFGRTSLDILQHRPRSTHEIL